MNNTTEEEKEREGEMPYTVGGCLGTYSVNADEYAKRGERAVAHF